MCVVGHCLNWQADNARCILVYWCYTAFVYLSGMCVVGHCMNWQAVRQHVVGHAWSFICCLWYWAHREASSWSSTSQFTVVAWVRHCSFAWLFGVPICGAPCQTLVCSASAHQRHSFTFQLLHRWRDFKFIVPVNAFQAVDCTMGGSMWRT